jgi:hypothetical protein
MTIPRILCAAAVAVLLATPAAFAQGNSGCSGTIQNGGGQDSCNAYGLCRAYFVGAEKKAPPFQALEAAACSGDQTCSGSDCPCFNGNCEAVSDCVADFCPDTNPGGHGKNPGG